MSSAVPHLTPRPPNEAASPCVRRARGGRRGAWCANVPAKPGGVRLGSRAGSIDDRAIVLSILLAGILVYAWGEYARSPAVAMLAVFVATAGPGWAGMVLNPRED